MEILEYDQVDPIAVLQFNLRASGFPLTPEYAADLRGSDARLHPCFTLHAVEKGLVYGQAGILHLPVMSVEGAEDVGGIWRPAFHPGSSGRGIAAGLVDEAHARMVAEGLRFSTLHIDRNLAAYRLFQSRGYADMAVWSSALARWSDANRPTRLRAEPPGPAGGSPIDEVFQAAAVGRLGFARRPAPFAPLRNPAPEAVCVLWEAALPVGYALFQHTKSVLAISDLLLGSGLNAVEAVAAVAAKHKAEYVLVKNNLPAANRDLRAAGYRVAPGGRSAFMMKSLVPEIGPDEMRRLFGIGTDRFLISWLDLA